MPIVVGVPDDDRVLLRAAEVQAVVGVEWFSDDSIRHICSGVSISSDIVLTAAHCVSVISSSVRIFTGPSLSCPLAVFSAAVTRRDDELDLAIVKIETAKETAVAPIVSLSWQDEPIDDSWIGREAIIAGFGVESNADPNRRLLAEEKIVGLSENYVHVSGSGKSGACIGDSGGPLIIKDEKGSAVALGILSVGSESCRGEDKYVRLDINNDWLLAQIAIARNDSGDSKSIEHHDFVLTR